MEDNSSLELELSKLFSDLSYSTSVPNTENEITAFDSDEVVFIDGSWLNYLKRIQVWLKLESELKIDETEEETIKKLTREFGGEGKDIDYYSISGNTVKPSNLLLEELRDRAEKAIKARDSFLEVLESRSMETAMDAWNLEWEDYLGSPAISSEPIIGRLTQLTINEFASMSEDGDLDLSPSYQRDEVWSLKDSQKLIESILRGIPLPSIILMDPTALRNTNLDQQAPMEVVDGKQRLTAILRFMGAHPKAIAKVDELERDYPTTGFKNLFETDYRKFRSAWNNNPTLERLTSEVEKKYCLPYKLSSSIGSLPGKLANLRGKFFSELRNEPVDIGGKPSNVGKVFEAGAHQYKIPVIIFESASPRQIHDVFHLYNKQGKSLNAEEIRNAVYHDVKLLRYVSSASEKSIYDSDYDESVPSGVVEQIGTRLDEAGIPKFRYRRTKVVSWILSILLSDCMGNDGKPRKLSTSQQINEMLDNLIEKPGHKYNKPVEISALLTRLGQSMEAHASSNAWSSGFKGGHSKWQDLPYVASVLGVILCGFVLEDNLAGRLQEVEQTLKDKLPKRPEKTQTETQWRFIASTIMIIADEMGVPLDKIESKSIEITGISCVEMVQALAMSQHK